MQKFEYDIASFEIVDRWTSKRMKEEMASLIQALNDKGNEGWELVGLHSFDLVGGFTKSAKGTVTVTLWKRTVE